MKLFIGVVCLALIVAASEEDVSSKYPAVYNYHRRFGIPRANELLKFEAEDVQVQNSQRIVGGTSIDISQVPYQAGLVITVNIIYRSVCGASLISQNRLVTAAHCQHDGVNTANSFTVVLGSNTLFTGGTRINTRDVVMHPLWNFRNAENDVAVLRLEDSVEFSNIIQPISLPDNLNVDFQGWTACASGFGITVAGGSITTSQSLSAVDLTIISNSECAAVYDTWMHSTNICTSGADGMGPCGGDSGGPLTVTIDGVNVLIGSTSYGSDQGCHAGFPAAYARITSYISWIRSI